MLEAAAPRVTVALLSAQAIDPIGEEFFALHATWQQLAMALQGSQAVIDAAQGCLTVGPVGYMQCLEVAAAAAAAGVV